MSTVEVVAAFLRKKWRADGGEGAFCIAEAKLVGGDDKGTGLPPIFTIKGEWDSGELKQGLEYLFYGKLENYTPKPSKFDADFSNFADRPAEQKQLKLETFVLSTPHEKAGVVAYLGEAPGIGRITAGKLWEKFQGQAVRVLREQPHVAAAAVKTLTMEKATEAAAYLETQKALEDCTIELQNILNGRQGPKATVRRAIQIRGNRAAVDTKNNPYWLMRFPGWGFVRCDSLYKDLGLPLDALRRQAYAMWHAITSNSEGHTWFRSDFALKGITDQVGRENKNINPGKAYRLANRIGGLTHRFDGDGQLWIGEKRKANNEQVLAELVAEAMRELEPMELSLYREQVDSRRIAKEYARCTRCRRKLTADVVAVLAGKPFGPDCITKIPGGERAERMPLEDWLEAAGEVEIVRTSRSIKDGTETVTFENLWPAASQLEGTITDHQREEYEKATQGTLGSLGGSPGTGKTFVVAAAAKAIIATYGAGSLAIMAPTGKASARCTEAMRGYGIQLTARTIHSTLGVEVADSGDGWGFKHRLGNPLPYQFLIVDECSMIDTDLAKALFAARARGTHILLVGDIGQLPPVGHGAPLRDLLAAGIPYGELIEIKRNAGSIVRACKAIKAGEMFVPDQELNPYPQDGSEPRNLKLVYAKDGDKTVEEIIKIIRRLSAMNRFDKEAGWVPVNPIWSIQVIVAVNEVSPVSRKKLNDLLQLELNGNSQKIESSPFRKRDKVIEGQNSFYPLADGQGEAWVANGEFGEVIEVQPKKTIISFTFTKQRLLVPRGKADEGKDGEKSSTGCSIELGYACTCHRMQGSQCQIVIVGLDERQSGRHGICKREWLYTAISRAEEICFLVGKPATARKMIADQALPKRKTFLTERIRECLAIRDAQRNRPVFLPLETASKQHEMSLI